MTVHMTNPKIRTITKEELAQKIENVQPVQIVNVLDPKYYHLGFIKGSKRIPLDQLDKRLAELDKNLEVVTYCASYDCPASGQAAEKLLNKGFRVSVYEGGIKEWLEAGLPTD
jgi:rhodanese-related sulfurtransferase